MSIDDFVRYSKMLHRLTADVVRAVPEDKWNFTPNPPGRPSRAAASHRIGDGFAPFCKQLRHVVCSRGVYNAALATKRVDWTRKHEHYVGPLSTRLSGRHCNHRRVAATAPGHDLVAIDQARREFRHERSRTHRRREGLPSQPWVNYSEIAITVRASRLEASRAVRQHHEGVILKRAGRSRGKND